MLSIKVLSMKSSYVNSLLNPLYDSENPIQAINACAKNIEKTTGINVLKFHLGNPTAPQNESTNQIASRYFAMRGQFLENRGYTDVAGNPDILNAIALALNKLNRLEGSSKITGENLVGANGGTGALNVAISIVAKIAAKEEAGDNSSHIIKPIVLVTDPSYPAWRGISKRLEVGFDTFKLRAEDDYLLNEEVINRKIDLIKSNPANKDRPIILMYHYPHNPTGKTLTKEEAEAVAKVLNNLCKKHNNLLLIQEDLYLATTKKEMGIYTPLPYLQDEAKDRVMWLHSPSKEGHPQDRGAVMGAFNKDIIKHLRGAMSFDALGTSTPALLTTAATLIDIAQGGVDAWTDDVKTSQLRQSNYRFEKADYYQERLRIVHGGLKEIEAKLNEKSADGRGVRLFHGKNDGPPQGTYYLYPDFSFLQGRPIPPELQAVCSGNTIFKNSDDISMALANAHLIGLQPMTVASGTLFERDNPNIMTLRISTVDPDINAMHGAVKTLKGFVQKTMGIDLSVKFETGIDALKTQHPSPAMNNGGKENFIQQILSSKTPPKNPAESRSPSI